MQTTHKIDGESATGFASYLTDTTRGDYYLPTAEDPSSEGDTPGGGRAGRWHGSPDALAALGLSHENPVQRAGLLALMRGLSPETGKPIRAAGSNGTRVTGIDLTFSAPKSVSALWAVGSPYRRAQIEAAHGRAVRGAMARMERDVTLMRRRERGEALAQLARERELIPLEGDLWTTRQLREREQRTLATAASRARQPAAPVRQATLHAAQRETERELGAPLSAEQREALATITGQGGVTVLVGQAGTGKGVVLRSAAEAWRREGNEVIGTAVAGATAQRLQADANLNRAMTTDSLLAKSERGSLELNERTVVVMDEAGMADTNRLAQITQLTAETDSKLVLVGDAAQLSPIGAGGLFKDLQHTAPSARLSEVHRAREQWERAAWGQIRAGESARALAAYQARDCLHVTDTRAQAANEMVDAWDRARLQHGAARVTMLTDSSNRELDEINAQAQARRDARGELGTTRVELPDRPYDLAAGDQIIFTAPHHRPDERRIENGTLAEITNAHADGTLTIRTHEPRPRELNVDTNEFSDVKLAYAQHVYKAQGQTVDRAFVLTGGWQTDRERAYVAMTRARESTDILASRQDLGQDGLDATAIDRLADTISRSNAQQASIAHREATPDREGEAARLMRESREQTHDRGPDIE